ncbi:uncharacterized protein [Panulirus ornatus]|uniref:uncharacterized protein n=1 Tax=Panulirus ornatus TaxID=150431 RepID=UPI003A8A4F0E
MVSSAPYNAALFPALLLQLLLLGLETDAALPEGSQGQGRIIPPFSPSLELARSLGSSPVTPQGKENPNVRAAATRLNKALGEEQFSGYTHRIPGSSVSQETYERGATYDRSHDMTVDEDADEVLSLGDLPLGEEEDAVGACPPRLPLDHIIWRRSSRVVRATLPHQVFSSCTPPLRCSVTTTVHRRVFLQEGDTLEVILQTPPDYTPPTTTEPQPTSTTPPTAPTLTTPEERTTAEYSHEDKSPGSTTLPPVTQQAEQAPSLVSPQQQPQQQPQPPAQRTQQPANGNATHIFSRDDHPTRTSYSPTRRRRQVVGGAPHFPKPPPSTRTPAAVLDQGTRQRGRKGKAGEDERPDPTVSSVRENGSNQTSSSPLTIWRASLAEWTSCSTREGSQVGESGSEGVVTVGPRDLQAGINYFIGRSSWSSTECFKLQVTVRSAECGEGSLCSGKGVCYTQADMEHFKCQCCQGYMGTHCEEMNACTANPCLNSGLCVDIQEGHDGDTFQCLCLYGYKGRYCEEQTNLCESVPCSNGGTCTGNHSSYSCLCPIGWAGPQCTEPSPMLGEQAPEDPPDEEADCTAGPCLNGVCVETSTMGAKCFCVPGYGGERCDFEYNECDSNPCENGGTCTDQIGVYQCHCGRGYTGERCQIKYDLCSPNPCPASRVCVDKGNSYSCECLNGLSEDDCGPHTQLCAPNPCDNGGTCWIVPDSHVYFCACRPGFTGTTCQGILQEAHDEAVPETVGAVATVESVPLDGHLPMDMPLYHLKNIYVAIATLASALLIFALVVGACHCRVNRTYRKCFVKMPRPNSVFHNVRRPRPTSLFDKPRRGDRTSALRLEADPDGAAMPMTSSNSNSDAVYYNMDLCDNQELPLIK